MKSATDMPGLSPRTEVALQAEDIGQERLIRWDGCGECPQHDDVKLGRMAADSATVRAIGETVR